MEISTNLHKKAHGVAFMYKCTTTTIELEPVYRPHIDWQMYNRLIKQFCGSSDTLQLLLWRNQGRQLVQLVQLVVLKNRLL